MLCVKGQVGKGTATKSAFWHANHKKILCLNPGLLYLRKQFSASTRHPYDIFDASSFCKLSLAALCNRCSYALLYDIFNTSQFCLASLQLPFAVLCDHRLHALWLSDYVRLTPTEGQGTFVPNQCWDDVYKMPCFWEIHLVFTHSSGYPHLRGSTHPLHFTPTLPSPFTFYIHTPFTLYILHTHSLSYSTRGSNVQHFSLWWRSSLSSSAVRI